MYSCDPTRLQESELEQQAAAESLIPLDVADVGFRRSQIAVDHVGEGDRRSERCSRRSEPRDDSRLELRKRFDVERGSLHELPVAAADDRAPFGQHG